MSIFDSIFSGKSGIASTIIDIFSVDAEYTHTEKGEYNPITNENDTVSTTIKVKSSPLLNYSYLDLNDTTIQRGDCKVIVKGADISVVSNNVDSITIGGKTFIVVDHKVVRSGDSTAIITLHLQEREA